MTMAEFLKERGASHGAIELLEYPYASAEDDPVSLLWNLRDNWYASRETTRYKIDGGVVGTFDLYPRKDMNGFIGLGEAIAHHPRRRAS